MKYAKINAAVVATVLTLTLAGCGKEEAQDAKSARPNRRRMTRRVTEPSVRA